MSENISPGLVLGVGAAGLAAWFLFRPRANKDQVALFDSLRARLLEETFRPALDRVLDEIITAYYAGRLTESLYKSLLTVYVNQLRGFHQPGLT